jgi:hypothetical protein
MLIGVVDDLMSLEVIATPRFLSTSHIAHPIVLSSASPPAPGSTSKYVRRSVDLLHHLALTQIGSSGPGNKVGRLRDRGI